MSDKSDRYSLMDDIFNSYDEHHPYNILNYIIYYSFKEEQEAYTVGGSQYFSNVGFINDINSETYINILKNSPYHIVFQRLGIAQNVFR